MMTRKIAALLGLSLLAMTAACNKIGAKAPTGQVVATVNGTDITVRELNAELAQTQAPPDTPRKTVESVVLARVIERRMLADAARERDNEVTRARGLAEQCRNNAREPDDAADGKIDAARKDDKCRADRK